jgi:class 3 adenylate cyclase
LIPEIASDGLQRTHVTEYSMLMCRSCSSYVRALNPASVVNWVASLVALVRPRRPTCGFPHPQWRDVRLSATAPTRDDAYMTISVFPADDNLLIRKAVRALMSDIRGCSGIAERVEPTTLAGQLSRHRAEMNRAIIDHGGTVMQFVGDAVMEVFGAPDPIDDRAQRATTVAKA